MLDKIRKSHSKLELIWADGGYNARQVTDSAAKIPCLMKLEIIKRNVISADSLSCCDTCNAFATIAPSGLPSEDSRGKGLLSQAL